MYRGSLFKIAGEEFPHKWIYKDSYSVTPHVLDMDSTRTASGGLQRNVLDHTSVTVTFQTVPMTIEEYDKLWEFIRSKYTVAKEKKFRGSYYNFESGEMESGNFYVPDTSHNPYMAHRNDGLMNPTTLEFIGY